MMLASLVLAASVPASAPPRPSQTLPPILNGVEEEYDDYQPPNRKNCPVLRPRDDEEIVLLGFGGGSAVPTFSVSSGNDITTSGEIRLGSGPANMFLVLSSYDPILYRLTGRVDRLSRVVLLSRIDAGLTGIDGRRVSIGLGNNCVISIDGPSTDKDFKTLFGREPGASASEEELHLWIIGSRGAGRKIDAPPPVFGEGTYLEQEVDLHYPGGVVAVQAAEIVSSRTPNETLPSIVGALQLERAGAIVPATAADIAQWEAKARDRYGDQVVDAMLPLNEVYRVTRRVQIPAGLCGALTISFLVPSSDFISGTPCHSNIIGTNGRIYHRAGHYDPEELKDDPRVNSAIRAAE